MAHFPFHCRVSLRGLVSYVRPLLVNNSEDKRIFVTTTRLNDFKSNNTYIVYKTTYGNASIDNGLTLRQKVLAL